MVLPFASRSAAADKLSDRLKQFQGRTDTTIVAIPRGGIPVAARIACNLQLPLDILAVEKVQLDDNRTLGAIASDGTEVTVATRKTGFSPDATTIARARQQALREVTRKSELYRRPSGPPLAGRCAIVVVDGIDSGLTMLAAARSLKRAGAARIVLAAPVASPQASEMLEPECDELICLATPKPFNALDECYLDFALLSDDDCTDILVAVDRAYERHGHE